MQPFAKVLRALVSFRTYGTAEMYLINWWALWLTYWVACKMRCCPNVDTGNVNIQEASRRVQLHKHTTNLSRRVAKRLKN